MQYLELWQQLELLDALSPTLTHVLKLNWHIIMAQANPGGDQPKDDSSDCPSEQYSNSDCEEPDPAEMARAEQRELQAMRDAYTRALQMRDRQPQPDDGHLEEDKDRA